MQPSRRGRQLLSVDLSADNTPAPSSHQASAIPQKAFASTAAVAAPAPAQRLCSHGTHSCQTAPSSAFPLQHVEERTSTLACSPSEWLQNLTCPAPSSKSNQSLPTPRDAPPLHAPRAIPGVQSSSIPLGPIRQPLQGGPPCNPLYIARALSQAPSPQNQQLYSGQNATQLSESQQRFHQKLAAARAIGYCQGVRQGAIESLAPTPLTFSRRQQSNNTGQHTSLGDSMLVHPASRHTCSNEAAGLAQSSNKRPRLVHIAETQQRALPPSQGLIKFKCSVADILDAHWPGAASQAASKRRTAEVLSTACPRAAAPETSSGQEVKPQSAGVVSCRALPSSLGRGASRRLLSVPSCSAPGTSTLLPHHPSVPVVSADVMAASTTAFESLTLGPEAQSRRTMPPPHRATAHTVQCAVVAAQAAAWASSPRTAALQSPNGSYSNFPQSLGQGSVGFCGSSRSQVGAVHPLGFALSSFPQMMSQLLAEPSMHAMQAWAATYRPPGTSSSQQAIQAANQSPARPQKRARQGNDCFASTSFCHQDCCLVW